MAKYGFHPEALLEYAEATTYFVQKRSISVAQDFVASVESAVESITSTPDRWRFVEAPDIRRYVIRRFPYVVYYQWNPEQKFVTVVAVMHCSREPGYWKRRIA